MKIASLAPVLFYFVFTPHIHSQSIDVSVLDIYERRTSISFRSELVLEISVDFPSEVYETGRIQISKAFATDENGDSLHLIPLGWEFLRHPTRVKLKLELPSRKTQTLSQIHGKIKILKPSEENGSIIRIKDFTSQTNRNLLAQYDDQLKLSIADSVDYTALFEVFKQTDEQSLLEENPNLSEKGRQAHFESIDNAQEQNKKNAQSEQVILLATDDLNKDIIKLDIYDEEGESQFNYGIIQDIPIDDYLTELLHLQGQGFQHLTLSTFSLAKTPGKNWVIELLIANDHSTQEYTFSLYDIILP